LGGDDRRAARPLRDEQGISQLRLAERLCAASGQATVTRHEVSRWEREDGFPPLIGSDGSPPYSSSLSPNWNARPLPLAAVEEISAIAEIGKIDPSRRRRGSS
jgi:hypothetical protein